jgi:spermidine synthase
MKPMLARLRAAIYPLRHRARRQRLPAEKVFFSARSPYQKIEIVTIGQSGKSLVLDGIHQSAEASEFIYHEAVVHPAMCLHADPKRVLIIGGGEGATLREVLRHPGVGRAVMVDIDEMVVEACREHLGWDDGAYDDPRSELIIGDGVKYMRDTGESFDVIIVDSTTPIPGSISYNLYGDNFYKHATARLLEGGILAGLVSNANFLYSNEHALLRQTLRAHFTEIHSYLATDPIYPIVFAFTLASNDPGLDVHDLERVDARLQSVSGDLRYYDAETHCHLFSLPRYLRQHVDDPTERRP